MTTEFKSNLLISLIWQSPVFGLMLCCMALVFPEIHGWRSLVVPFVMYIVLVRNDMNMLKIEDAIEKLENKTNERLPSQD